MAVIRSLLLGLIMIVFFVATLAANLGFWGLRTVLDTGTFVAIVDPLLGDAEVRDFVSGELSERLGALLVNQNGKIAPAALSALGLDGSATAGQVTRALWREIAVLLADPALDSMRRDVLTELHAAIVRLMDGSTSVDVQGEALVLDLQGVVTSLDEKLDPTRSGFFGRDIPADLGQVPIFEAQGLARVSTVYALLKVGEWLLPTIAILIGMLALLVAPRRLSALAWVGLMMLIAGLLCILPGTVGGSFLANAAAAQTAGEAAVRALIEGLASQLTLQSAILAGAGALLLIICWAGGRLIGHQRSGISFA